MGYTLRLCYYYYYKASGLSISRNLYTEEEEEEKEGKKGPSIPNNNSPLLNFFPLFLSLLPPTTIAVV